MCGRLNIMDDPFVQQVCEQLGIQFSAKPNPDLRPTETLATVGAGAMGMQQFDLRWGIKPHWAKRVIINAQAETVASKPTFKHAFETSRVVVPCGGWYEWTPQDNGKQKYLFQSPSDEPLYMAAIALESMNKVVTLTTKPDQGYAQYYHRMPLLIPRSDVSRWLFASLSDAKDLLHLEEQQPLKAIPVVEK
ncbi:SOS response-associated peptidase family protein [Vibrio sp. SCSIO 43132]|uniref:SOS response-associated peptidase n=1 Tax=Vibrio sp. SCSIO 43132 TaxID=2779363 RepID=UPI00397792B9|nr:SOS response-associated peptidase family protein [Vibrio sp. SCSIO 43132]